MNKVIDWVLFCSSIILFQGLLNDENETAEEYFSHGYACFRSRRFKLALKYFDRVLELNPNHIDAYIYRASTHSHLGDFELAIIDANKAIELNPNKSQAYLNLGLAYEKTGEEKKAINCLYKAADLGDKLAQRYIMMTRSRRR